jgi:hypothetical protein
MTPDGIDPKDAADILFFEAEAGAGFLRKMELERQFDDDHWQRLWDAAASLISHHNGTLDTWSTFDLMRIVEAVQLEGQKLAGRSYNELDDFEEQVLEANLFLSNIFTAP